MVIFGKSTLNTNICIIIVYEYTLDYYSCFGGNFLDVNSAIVEMLPLTQNIGNCDTENSDTLYLHAMDSVVLEQKFYMQYLAHIIGNQFLENVRKWDVNNCYID